MRDGCKGSVLPAFGQTSGCEPNFGTPHAITDPSEPEPMTGTAWSSTGSRDGRWQLTLYLKPGGNTTDAFVHACTRSR